MSQVQKIIEQIQSTRDIDAESFKPKLSSDKPTAAKTKTDDKTKQPKPVTSSLIKPEIPKIEHQPILNAVIPFPLQPVPMFQISTYIPCSRMMYFYVHQMDLIMTRSFYFRRQHEDWYPLISRLYFGILFYIQTLRAATSVSRTSARQYAFLQDFLDSYPPETLPVPGPLVSIFESLSVSYSSEKQYNAITPVIPGRLGPRQASDLVLFFEDSPAILMLPNIPLILGFLANVTTALPNATPDYSDPATFSDAAARSLNGHIFQAGAWNQLERNALQTPGLLYLVETDLASSNSFRTASRHLQLPIIAAAQDLGPLNAFLGLTQDTWFGKILTIMESYSTYFLGSRTLADCATSRHVSGLISTHYDTLSAPLANNNVNALNHAFPNDALFTLEAYHTSTERDLPPAAALTAQASQLNVVCGINQPLWVSIGQLGVTRSGPYWSRSPIHRQSASETVYKGIPSLIKKEFYIPRPIPKKE